MKRDDGSNTPGAKGACLLHHTYTGYVRPLGIGTYMRDMSAGTRFVDAHGDIWQRHGRHGSHNDVWLATRERDGYESCFGGCARLEVPT
jgi:hypothetical protein